MHHIRAQQTQAQQTAGNVMACTEAYSTAVWVSHRVSRLTAATTTKPPLFVMLASQTGTKINAAAFYVCIRMLAEIGLSLEPTTTVTQLP